MVLSANLKIPERGFTMSEWLRPICQPIAPEDIPVLSVICAVLALLVLAAIVLGFGPLRAWLGLTRALAGDEDGLRVAWRLYREVSRTHPHSTAFSGPDLSVTVVPGDLIERAWDTPPKPDRDITFPMAERPTIAIARLRLVIEQTDIP